jgi:hypothetical protein
VHPVTPKHKLLALQRRTRLPIFYSALWRARVPASLTPILPFGVSSVIREIKSIDYNTGLINTLTPSEPVLAKAAMEHLCDKANWTYSIRTLTKELLKGRLVDKGHKGELYIAIVY